MFNAVSSKIQPSTGNSAPVFAEITQDLPVAAASVNIAATLRAGDFSIDIYDTSSATFIESIKYAYRAEVMLNSFHPDHTFIACGYTDLRRGIDGLAIIVAGTVQNSLI